MKHFGEKKPLMKQFGAQASFDETFRGEEAFDETVRGTNSAIPTRTLVLLPFFEAARHRGDLFRCISLRSTLACLVPRDALNRGAQVRCATPTRALAFHASQGCTHLRPAITM